MDPKNRMRGFSAFMRTRGAKNLDRPQRILEAIDHAVHFLPSQGPIAVFVHHNTLHAFEHQSFHQAVLEGWRTYGHQPYWSESKFRQEFASGRIQVSDLERVLVADLGDRGRQVVMEGLNRLELRKAMMEFPLLMAPEEELRWMIDETDALRQFRREASPQDRLRMVEETRRWMEQDYLHGRAVNDPQRIANMLPSLWEQFGGTPNDSWFDSTWNAFTVGLLWRLCRRGVHAAHASKEDSTHDHAADPSNSVAEPVQEGGHSSQFSKQGFRKRRTRELLYQATHCDPDLLVNDLLTRFLSSFLDQGFASWSLPNRDSGLFAAFIETTSLSSFFDEAWMRELRALLQHENHRSLPPLQSIEISLAALGIDDSHWPEFILETFLALPGWAGMIWQLEREASWTLRPAPQGTLQAFLAIRLLADRAANRFVAREHLQLRGPEDLLPLKIPKTSSSKKSDSALIHAFTVFQLAQVKSWSPKMLAERTQEEWKRLVAEIDSFPSMERRRIFQNAYESHYRIQALDAFSIHAQQEPIVPQERSFQLITCIDDREESLRRHVEEIDPKVVTFGAAGFFSVPMYFRGVSDAHYIPLCPIVMKPVHYVEETPANWMKRTDRRRADARKTIGKASHQVHLGSRGLLSGFVAAFLGSFASLPMVARVLFPRLTSKLRQAIGKVVQPPPTTQLMIERTEANPGPENGHRGFSEEEMASMARRLLEDIGLTSNFSNIVIILGHGSSSLNNPHESAYNCGACGGGRGGPNARALADICNDPRIRLRLANEGLMIPLTTWFIGGYHNTCDDQITLFDLERSPPPYRNAIDQALSVLDEARQRNAHERCRRFETASSAWSPRVALHHVETRSEDLAQARPEYNHATNAMCVVGRRGRSRSLFLDRRSFLTSYDPTQDDAQGTILGRILQAVIPVCGGISLEYYFSCVDPTGYGCGSKLPHNITSLIGVMEGASSDLRTGLSQQMVEIHEPMRILFLVETKPSVLISIIERNPILDRMVKNHWVQLATLAPDSAQIHLFEGDRFVRYEPNTRSLPEVTSSSNWYSGFRDHLGFATISAGRPQPTEPKPSNQPVSIRIEGDR